MQQIFHLIAVLTSSKIIFMFTHTVLCYSISAEIKHTKKSYQTTTNLELEGTQSPSRTHADAN